MSALPSKTDIDAADALSDFARASCMCGWPSKWAPGYCGIVSAKRLRAAAAKVCILRSRSALPVSSVMARSTVPATARLTGRVAVAIASWSSRAGFTQAPRRGEAYLGAACKQQRVRFSRWLKLRECSFV